MAISHSGGALEAEAMLLILTHIEAGRWQWIGSEILDFEIEQIPDQERRDRVKFLATHIYRSVPVERTEMKRAQQLEVLGFHPFDALHLARAENGGASIFLTTDDKLLRLAVRLSEQLRVRVENPLAWAKEVAKKWTYER